MLGTFVPTPSPMIKHIYTQDQLQPKHHWTTIDCDGYWQIRTDGINVLT